MSKILKNTTGSIIEIDNMGLQIPASDQITINIADYLLLADPQTISDLTTQINSGDIVVNNGVIDLSASQGILYIEYPNSSENILLDSLTVSGDNVKEGLENIQDVLDILGQISEYENTDITTNINNSTSALYIDTVPIFGVESNNTGGYTVNLVNQYVTVNYTGIVSISVNIHVESFASRVAPQFRLRVNGTAIGPVTACTYIRATNDHNESSAHIASFLLEVTSGDQISLGSRRGAKAGTATMSIVGTSDISLTRIE